MSRIKRSKKDQKRVVTQDKHHKPFNTQISIDVNLQDAWYDCMSSDNSDKV